MKRVFSMLVALTVAVMSYSQSSLVATLSHNGEISAYYGNTALKEAHDAAEHGDIITLSSGTFASVNITKALTIRGAGIYVDSIARVLPTLISGNFDINIPDSTEQHLTMEGIYNNNTISVAGLPSGASFLKCRFFTFSNKSTSQAGRRDITFVHCKITNGVNLDNSFVTYINSYIALPYNTTPYPSSSEYLNCFIVRSSTSANIYNSNLTNCIIYDKTSNSYTLSTSTAYYCLGISSDVNIFSQISNENTTNMMFTGELNTIFKTYTGTYDDNETFELTDEAKTLYLGNDQTEVGMYGGTLPFNPLLSYPKIVKFNVASESTADGKLSVDIEVSSGK